MDREGQLEIRFPPPSRSSQHSTSRSCLNTELYAAAKGRQTGCYRAAGTKGSSEHTGPQLWHTVSGLADPRQLSEHRVSQPSPNTDVGFFKPCHPPLFHRASLPACGP